MCLLCFVSSRRKEIRFHYLLYLKKAASCCKSLFLRHVVHLCCYIFVLFSGRDVWVNCLLFRSGVNFVCYWLKRVHFCIPAVLFNMFGFLFQVRIVFVFIFFVKYYSWVCLMYRLVFLDQYYMCILKFNQYSWNLITIRGVKKQKHWNLKCFNFSSVFNFHYECLSVSDLW